MKYYVPSADLTESQRKKRNKKNNEVLKRYRQKRKEQENNAQEPNQNTNGYETNQNSDGQNSLIVRMPFGDKRSGTRKRISRAVSKANREIKHLKQKN